MILKVAEIRQNCMIIVIFVTLGLVQWSLQETEKSKGINEVLDELIEQAEKSNKKAAEAKKTNNNSRIIYLRQDPDKNASHPITKPDEDKSERQNVFEHFGKTSSMPMNTIPPSIEDVVVEILGNEKKAHESKLNQTPEFSKEEWIIDIEEKNDEANSQTEVNKHTDKDVSRAAPESVEIISEEILVTKRPTEVTEENFYYNNSEKEREAIRYNKEHNGKPVQGRNDNDNDDRPNMYSKIKKLIEQILIMQSIRNVDQSQRSKKKKPVDRAGREEGLSSANPLMNYYNQFIRNNPTIRRVDIDPPKLQIPSPLTLQEPNVVSGPSMPFHPVLPLVPSPMVPNDVAEGYRWRVSNGLQYLLARRSSPDRTRIPFLPYRCKPCPMLQFPVFVPLK